MPGALAKLLKTLGQTVPEDEKGEKPPSQPKTEQAGLPQIPEVGAGGFQTGPIDFNQPFMSQDEFIRSQAVGRRDAPITDNRNIVSPQLPSSPLFGVIGEGLKEIGHELTSTEPFVSRGERAGRVSEGLPEQPVSDPTTLLDRNAGAGPRLPTEAELKAQVDVSKPQGDTKDFNWDTDLIPGSVQESRKYLEQVATAKAIIRNKGELEWSEAEERYLFTAHPGQTLTKEEAGWVTILSGGGERMANSMVLAQVQSDIGTAAALTLSNAQNKFIADQNRISNDITRARDAASNAQASNNFNELVRSNREVEMLQRERLEMDKKQDKLQFFMSIASNPALLFFMNQFGMTAEIGKLLGMDMSAFNVAGPVNPLSQFNVQQLTQMSPDQRKMVLFSLQAQTGLSTQEILAEIQSGAPGGIAQVSRSTLG